MGGVGDVLLRALPREFSRGRGSGSAAHERSAERGAARLHGLAPTAAVRTLAPVGYRDPPHQPGRLLYPQRRRRGAQRSGYEDRGRVGAYPVRRPPGAPRIDGPVGQWQERQRVPLHQGEQAGGRHLQRGGGGAVPLEGFGAGRPGNPALGTGRHRQWTASLVHEILWHALRPALASGGGRTLRLALPQSALPAPGALAGARGPGVFATSRSASPKNRSPSSNNGCAITKNSRPP